MSKKIILPTKDPWAEGFEMAEEQVNGNNRTIAILEAMRMAEINGRNHPLKSFENFFAAYCYSMLFNTNQIDKHLNNFEKECLDRIHSLGF